MNSQILICLSSSVKTSGLSPTAEYFSQIIITQLKSHNQSNHRQIPSYCSKRISKEEPRVRSWTNHNHLLKMACWSWRHVHRDLTTFKYFFMSNLKYCIIYIFIISKYQTCIQLIFNRTRMFSRVYRKKQGSIYGFTTTWEEKAYTSWLSGR